MLHRIIFEGTEEEIKNLVHLHEHGDNKLPRILKQSPSDIYNLELHETVTVETPINVSITRVPGGWLYRFMKNGIFDSIATFVPIGFYD